MTQHAVAPAPKVESTGMADLVRRLLGERNGFSRAFFAAESPKLAVLAREMAQRFGSDGRLILAGRAEYATDAQHMEVEFVHPVIVGKRALPAVDVSGWNAAAAMRLVSSGDMVVCFGPQHGDSALAELCARARQVGAVTCGLGNASAEYAFDTCTRDPFIHQEIVEIVCHTLWETVHIYLERRGSAQAPGAAGFLYPFLQGGASEESGLVADVAASIEAKAAEVNRLRDEIAVAQSDSIVRAASAIADRVSIGGRLLIFGNGGSATDANDMAMDCTSTRQQRRPVPAISLASSAAILSGLANDLGAESLFLRQLIAHGRPADVAFAISTSGSSKNVLAALETARQRGMLTVALLGGDGGDVVRRGLADHALVVHTDYIPRIQEAHASIYHVLLDVLEALHAGEVVPGAR